MHNQHHWLSDEERKTLEAICETFCPALSLPTNFTSSDTPLPILQAYYQRSAHDIQLARLVEEVLADENKSTRAEIRQLLRLFALPLTGMLCIKKYQTFQVLSQAEREKYVQALAYSPIPRLRKGYQAIKRLIGFLYFAAPIENEKTTNPNWSALDYNPPSSSHSLHSSSDIQPLTITQATILDCDVVVVGSGAGGSVVAGEVAQAGKSVIVLEMGHAVSDKDFTQPEASAMSQLYLKRGLLSTHDLGITVLAGSTLGGGTVINWCTSLRPPDYILDEWAQSSGLSCFTETALQTSFQAVEQRLGVNTQNSQCNSQNRKLLEGASELNYQVKTLPRNAIDCQERCGACCFGCRYNCKQSTPKTYLQDASQNGVRVITNCRVDRVLFEGTSATGVIASITDPQTGNVQTLQVRARIVVLAAGTIHTPAILLRSGVQNSHIGRHLHLHPTAAISAFYQEKIYPWQGVMQAVYSDEFARLNGNYGYVLEVPPVHPGLLGLAMPWYNARDYRERMQKIAHIATFIILTRDRDTGRITIDREGNPIIHYIPSQFDRQHLLHGMQTAARIHIAAGAEEVLSLHSRPTILTRNEQSTVNEANWQRFTTQLKEHGMAPNQQILFSAHQMGTCRMGKDPRQSVVNEHGQVHNTVGLFIADASLFPSASGVNPMLTIMALAHRLAQCIRSK